MIKNCITIEKYRQKIMSVGIQNGGHKNKQIIIFAASRLLDAIVAA